jgi:Fe-S cluster assembly ATP-binding protein
MLEVKDLHVEVEGKEILKGLNLTIKQGEIHALMGPNGSGKSTLSYVIMGHPKYNITKGTVLLDGKDIQKMKPNERARLGLFLGFQYPVEVPGVSLFNFLRLSYNSLNDGAPLLKPDPAQRDMRKEMASIMQFQKLLDEKMDMLKIDKSFAKRYLNDGFSGGEKKKCEILQMAVLSPKIAILDETDSGLDVDSLKTVSEGINKLRGPNLGVLLITHYNRILNYVKPDRVHVMIDGKIVKSDGPQLAKELEKSGYESIKAS